MRRLLITGGAGFIGANFVHYWLGRHTTDHVIVLDALTYAGNRRSLAGVQHNPRFQFVQADIRDQQQLEHLLRACQLDTIVHFAAETHVDRSISGPDTFIETNIIGTHCLLKAARAVWLARTPSPAHRFHHVSTDEVYGSLGTNDPAFREDTPYAPNSPYAASKAASDHLVRAYQHTYGLQTTTTNCSNNYGPYQFPEKLIPLMLINSLLGHPLPIYGNGLNIRDWLYVDDHCRGIGLVLERGRVGETYNIGGHNEKKNIDIIRQLCRLIDDRFAAEPELKARFPNAPAAKGIATSALITFVQDRPGHDRRYAIDASKIARELGYTPHESFDTGLQRTLDWYLGNESWWRSVMDGSYRDWMEQHYKSLPI